MHISSEQLFLSMARTCCTMKKLSALSGVSVQTLRNIKAGKAIFPETAGKIARALGVDIDSLLVSQPDTGEQALEITEALVRSGAIDVVVVDSVAALVPRAEIEGEMGDSFVGLHARLMSQAPASSPKPTASSSSSTSCGKRWASCTETPRSLPAAGL